MGLFEDIAVLDLKFRIVIVVLVVTFIGVSFSIVLVFNTDTGFVIGAAAAVVVAYLTAKRLS